MLRIRLQRFGRKHRPFYRISAVDRRTRRDGAPVEELGWYNPVEKDPAKQVSINAERVKHWISMGAQPTDTVRDMLAKRNLIDVSAWEADRAVDRKKVEAKQAALAAAAENKDEKKA
ncbi:MAG: 30S ribosomal protein S16 [Phycisphaeraceae bacterium]|nr:30S ribosomal protein S16 [Phycisphaerae bacterium]MBX3391967.1 30S ribosomal protein S16 [Phycisphaeraceae bacterium]HRJ49628.1 30S ribosomal protein S16 [Phycisphaerales bacterium]